MSRSGLKSGKSSKNGINQVRDSENLYIKQISAYHNRCESPVLKEINARHCFIIARLSNKQKILIEREEDFFRITYQIKSGYFIGYSRSVRRLSVKDLYNKLDSQCRRNGYNVINNNCYDFCAQICVFLNVSRLKQEINDAKTSTILRSVANVLTDVNTVKAVVDIAKGSAIGVIKKLPNTAKMITQTQIISKPFSLGGCILGEVIKSGFDIYQQGLKIQAVVKGIGNITAGSIGSYGGFLVGTKVGSCMGIIGGPVGTALGGAIGASIGLICGSQILKKLIPQNS